MEGISENEINKDFLDIDWLRMEGLAEKAADY